MSGYADNSDEKKQSVGDIIKKLLEAFNKSFGHMKGSLELTMKEFNQIGLPDDVSRLYREIKMPIQVTGVLDYNMCYGKLQAFVAKHPQQF